MKEDAYGWWIERQELFALVWSTPMVRLAERFGISDVALAKKCKNLGIPRPGVGYWARVAAGQKPKVPKLPDAKKGEPEQVHIRRVEITVIEYAPEIIEELAALESPDAAVKVAEDFRKAHPIIKQLRRISKSPKGRDRYDDQTLSVDVSKGSRKRALLLLDALFRALEEHQFTICVEENRAALYRQDVRVQIALSEHYKRYEYSEEERKRNWGYRYYYEPDGVLSIVLERWGTGFCNRRWKDLPTSTLEERLTSIVAEIVSSFDLIRQKQREERIEEERQAERQRSAEHRRIRREEERRRRIDLLRIVRMCERTERLTRVLDDFKRSSFGLRDEISPEGKFISWANEQAAQMRERVNGHLRALIEIVDKDIVRPERSQRDS